MKSTLGPLVFVLSASSISGSALAQEAAPKEQLRYKNLTVARANPLGLISVTDSSYRFRLFKSDSPLFKDNFIGVGGQMVLTPAFFRVGPMLELQPLSILYLQATFEAVDYFGSFGFFQSFEFATDDWSDSGIDALEASDDPDEQNYSTSGWQFSGQAQFRFKVGPIAVRDTFRAGRPDYDDIREGDQLYYEPLFDILIPNGGWFVNNDVDLLYFTGRWKLGARWTYATAFYRDTDFAEGASTDDPNNPSNRVGPFVTYTFNSKSKFFQDPTLIFIANWWLEHRFRTGEDVSVALPYIILGITFTGDLFSSET
ncbi:MAG: hypothetical protein AAGD10_10125 [Myxococcota bacterium]